MKKLLLISLIIFYSLLSKAFCEDKINIPDGIWHGNFAVGGTILCDAKIYKIIVKNNKVSIHGNDIFGPSTNKFNLNENKYENKFFRLNNYTNRFKFTYLKKEKQIKISFSGACVGEGIFKLEENLNIKSRDHEKAEVEKEVKVAVKDTTRLEDMLVIAKTTCEEIGISDTDQKYGKCVLTLLKRQGYEDLLADASKTCGEIEIPDTDPKYIQCVLTIFKRLHK